MRIRRVLVAGALVAGVTTVAIPHGADAANLVVVTASTASGFVLPATPLLQGSGLDYTNVDPFAVHNLHSDTDLFSSGPLIPAGQTRHVQGVEDLAPGTYPFSCDLHGNMRGSLVVLPVADPTAGPVPAPTPPPAAAPGVVGGVATPTSIAIDGDTLYASSFGANTVYELPILPEGLLGAAVPYATGFNAPAGVVIADDGTMFVSDSHASNRGRTADGRVWAIPAGGGAAATVGQVVIDGLPNGRHNTNNLAIHDGRLFITNGNATDDGVSGGDPEAPLSGTLLSLPLSARGLNITSDTAPLPSGLVVEATGMRNIYDVAFRPGTDEAWLPMNGPDTFDPFGEDLLLKADTAGAAPDFGFPSCLYAPAGTPGGTPAGAFSIKQNPVISTPCDAGGAHALPEQLMGLHVSADGAAFTDDGSALYVALFGNFFGSSVVGHKVVKVPVDANGNAGPLEDVISLSAAPLDVTWSPFGLYVADFASGQISLVRI